MEVILVLDTNAYSDWRRAGRWHERIAIADRIVIPSVVIGELLNGFQRGKIPAENRGKLKSFLDEPQVEVMPVGLKTAEIYSNYLTFLQIGGTPIPTNDIWIAAIATECGGQLATRDEHFSNLPMLDLARER